MGGVPRIILLQLWLNGTGASPLAQDHFMFFMNDVGTCTSTAANIGLVGNMIKLTLWGAVVRGMCAPAQPLFTCQLADRSAVRRRLRTRQH